MLDFLIRGGVVADGTGTPLHESHVGIGGDRIVFVGNGEPAAAQVIDADGLIIAPGFIDTHSHSEFTLLADGRAEGKICQGVTTEISGNCGLSAAPLLGEAMQRREEDLRELGIAERWSTFTQYFSLLESRGISLNFATLCGHGNIRGSVMGYRNRRPDPGDMTRMKSLLAEALRDGAKGLSTGLIYPPGVYAETEELVALARGLSDVPCGIYASHMRSEGDALIEAIGEVVTIGRRARIPVHVSHLKTSGEQNWWKRGDAVECLEEARRSGVQVTCDRYP
ncbi:MAG TPA: amidohydrolase family protein, partial [Dissulfurispiraceae bacterium]|nr:amidohydrolase family protein [Dissulfurispiraceae bacterium]